MPEDEVVPIIIPDATEIPEPIKEGTEEIAPIDTFKHDATTAEGDIAVDETCIEVEEKPTEIIEYVDTVDHVVSSDTIETTIVIETVEIETSPETEIVEIETSLEIPVEVVDSVSGVIEDDSQVSSTNQVLEAVESLTEIATDSYISDGEVLMEVREILTQPVIGTSENLTEAVEEVSTEMEVIMDNDCKEVDSVTIDASSEISVPAVVTEHAFSVESGTFGKDTFQQDSYPAVIQESPSLEVAAVSG